MTRSMRDDVVAGLPGTINEVVAKSGVSRTAVWRWLNRLHEARQIHVAGWKRTPGGGPIVAVYMNGPGKDAECKLKPYTVAQLCRRYRLKARAEGTWEEKLALNRARWAAKYKGSNSDPLMAALFGHVLVQRASRDRIREQNGKCSS